MFLFLTPKIAIIRLPVQSKGEKVAENKELGKLKERPLLWERGADFAPVQDEHDNTLFIEMTRDGSYWNVNSAGIFRNGYSNKKETVAKTEPQQPNNAISDGSSLSTDAEGGITSAEPNGEPTVSDGKVTEKNNSAQQGSKETDKAEGTDIGGKGKKPSPDTKIDDVGERLEGARKDMRRKIAESLANVTEYPATASCPTGCRRPLLLFPPFLSFPHRLDTVPPHRNFLPLFLGSRSFQLSLQQIQAPDYLVPPRLVRKCVDSQGLFLWGSRSFPLSL